LFSTEIPELWESHLDHLKKSALSTEIIRERGYKTVSRIIPALYEGELQPGEIELAKFGFKQGQLLAPAILMPMYGVDGTVVLHQLRPDNPRPGKDTDKNGKSKTIKYETPQRRSLRIDVPPRCRKDIANPAVPLFITEGIKKGDALADAGGCVIGLPGVWGWKSSNEFGGKVFSADFDQVALNSRVVYIVFDSDIIEKEQVQKAMTRLAAILKQREAQVKVVHLPPGADGAKTGADDFLYQGHTLQDIMNLGQLPEEQNKELERVFESVLRDIKHNRMYAQTYDNDGNEKSIFPLTNFFAKVTHEIIRDDGQTKTRFFRLFGQCEDGSLLPQIDVPAESFDSLSWITSLWGLKPVMSPRNAAIAEVRHRIKVASKDFRSVVSYSHTGWREINGKMCYLTAGGAIGAENVVVDLEPELSDYRLPAYEEPRNDSGTVKPHIAEALKESLDFIKLGNQEITLPVWAAMYLAPLNPIIKTNFTLFVMGDTGTLKSSITAAALSHYGPNWNYLHLPGNWVSTANRLETFMYLVQDAPFVIDDFAPAANDIQSRNMEAMAERIIRDQGNRTGRARMTKDMMGRVTLVPRGLLVTSGEHLPGGQSRNARIFVVEVQKGDLNLDRLMELSGDDKRRQNYSVAMTQYIGWLAKRWSELKKELPKQMTAWLEQIRAGGHPRQDDAVAKLYAATMIGLQYHVEMGVINKKEMSRLAGDALEIYLEWARRQSERVERLSSGRQFLSTFITLLRAGKLVFDSAVEETDRTPAPGQTKVGWIDANEDYLLNPDMIYSVVKTFCQTTDNPLTVPAISVWRDLRIRGMSECTPGRNTYHCRINGHFDYTIKILHLLVDNFEIEIKGEKESDIKIGVNAGGG
jgi:hypothetical protein